MLCSGNDNYSIECSNGYKAIMIKTMWYLDRKISGIEWKPRNTSMHMKMYYIIEETLQTNRERLGYSINIGMMHYSRGNWL